MTPPSTARQSPRSSSLEDITERGATSDDSDTPREAWNLKVVTAAEEAASHGSDKGDSTDEVITPNNGQASKKNEELRRRRVDDDEVLLSRSPSRSRSRRKSSVDIQPEMDPRVGKLQKSSSFGCASPKRKAPDWDREEEAEPSLELPSLWAFVTSEALGEQQTTGLDDSIPASIDNFLAVPLRFERFVGFAVLVSIDTFLQAVTFLPLRAVVAVLSLFVELAGKLTDSSERASLEAWKRRFARDDVYEVHNGSSLTHRLLAWLRDLKLTRARAYDLMRFCTILLCNEALRQVPMSRAYHWIRGQNTIKLYVIIGIMEIFDRLACVLGQDALDSFYLTTRQFDKSAVFKSLRRSFLFLVVVDVVVVAHSLLYYVHLTTLNVVVNASEDSALVALLLSNNFSEIKSAVFKKYNADTLFQVACSDVCERFKLLLFLSLLVLLSWCQVAGQSTSSSWFTTSEAPAFKKDDDPLTAPPPKKKRLDGFELVASQATLVLLFEVVADWLKHAFVAKLNKIDAHAYDKYADRIARDVLTGRGGGLALDHTHAVAHRLGLAVLPLACVAVRYASISAGWLQLSLELSPFAMAIIFALFGLCLFLCKVLTSILLAVISINVLRKQHDTPEQSSSSGGVAPLTVGSKRTSSLPRQQHRDDSFISPFTSPEASNARTTVPEPLDLNK